MPPPRRVHLSTVLTWIAIVVTVAALLAEGIGLRDAGERRSGGRRNVARGRVERGAT